MRCLLSGLLWPALLPVALAQDNEAERLFRNMEKKILAAKGFEVAFDYQVLDAGEPLAPALASLMAARLRRRKLVRRAR